MIDITKEDNVAEPKKTTVREAVSLPDPVFFIKGLSEAVKETELKIKEEITIGRTEGNLIRIDDGNVSINHAVVKIENGQPVVMDKGSTNGTWINKEKAEQNKPVLLKNGDVVKFDTYEFRIIDRTPKKTTVREAVKMPELKMFLTGVSTSVLGKEVEVKGSVIIGRDEKSGFVIDEDGVSGSHAKLELDGNTLKVTDLGSTNGTSVNGKKIPPNQAIKLKNNDSIKFDIIEFRVKDATPKKTMVREAAPPKKTVARDTLDISGKAKIKILSGPAHGKVFVLVKDFTSIGRDATNDIVLDNENVSSRHCKIKRLENRWVLADLGSTNGTFVKEKRIKEETVIASGEELRVGDVKFTLEVEVEPKKTKVMTAGTKVMEAAPEEKKWFATPVFLSSLAAVLILIIAIPMIMGWWPSEKEVVKVKPGVIVFRTESITKDAGRAFPNASALLVKGNNDNSIRIIQSLGQHLSCMDFISNEGCFKLQNKAYIAGDNICSRLMAGKFQSASENDIYFCSSERFVILNDEGLTLAQYPEKGMSLIGRFSCGPVKLGRTSGEGDDIVLVTETGLVALLDGTKPKNTKWVSNVVSNNRIKCAPATYDFNKDKTPDVVVMAGSDGKVAVLNGASKGYAIITYPLAGYSFSYSPLAGDFDGDGIPEVVAVDDGGVFHKYSGEIPQGNSPGEELAKTSVGRPASSLVFMDNKDLKNFIVSANDGLVLVDALKGKKVSEWHPQSGARIIGTPRVITLANKLPGAIIADEKGYIYEIGMGEVGLYLRNSFNCSGAQSGKSIAQDPLRLADIGSDGILDVLVIYQDGSVEIITTSGYSVATGGVLFDGSNIDY